MVSGGAVRSRQTPATRPDASPSRVQARLEIKPARRGLAVSKAVTVSSGRALPDTRFPSVGP